MRVKVFAIHKDEPDLLEGFLSYHAYLFGWNNLHVIDNFSTDPRCARILEHGQLLGLNVKHERDFTMKDHHITNWMKLHQHECDYLVPLDIDEFIVFDKQTNQWSCDKTLILQEFASLPAHGRFAFPRWCFSLHNKVDYVDPLVELQYFVPSDFGVGNKKFFRSQKFVSTVPGGNHQGEVIGHEFNDFHNARLVLLHFHNCGARRLLVKSQKVCEAFGYDTSSEVQLELVVKNLKINCHCAQTVLDYKRRGWAALVNLDEPLQNVPNSVHFPDFAPVIRQIRDSVRLPTDFDWRVYLQKHEDLLRVFQTEAQAVRHYLFHGRGEGRLYR